MRSLFFILLLLTSIGGVVLFRRASDPAVDPDGSYLSPEERLKLFDLERADRLLGFALTPFLDAVRTRDEEGIRAALREDFLCSVPEISVGTEEVAEDTFYRSTILEEFQEMDRDGFQRWIFSLAEYFDEVDTVSFPRYHNTIENIQGQDAVAESFGAFRIAGRHGERGLVELSGSFRLSHDGFDNFDESGLDDRATMREEWIHELDLFKVSLISSVRPMFRDVTATCGVDVEALHDNWIVDDEPDITFTGGVYLGDVDDDGHLDMFVADILASGLYFGKGDGTFVDSGWRPRTPYVKGVGPEGGQVLRMIQPYAAIFDVDGNGRTDLLYCGQLYRWNKKKKQMVRREATALPAADASLCDYDRDGLVDLYFLNSGRRQKRSERKSHTAWFDDDRVAGTANALWRNLGGGKFEDVTTEANASPAYGRTFATTWFYANDDDWPDVFGANEFGRNLFLINQGDGTFREAPEPDDAFGGFSMGVVSGDVDGDGLADLYVSNMYSKAGQRVFHHLDLSIYPQNARMMFMASVSGNRMYRSRGDLSFDSLTARAGANAVGWGWSGAMFDPDLDGWLDIYAPCGYRSVNPDEPDG